MKKENKNISHNTIMNILGILVISLVIIAFAFSPIFVLRDIKISGNEYISDEEICRIAKISNGENMFQLETDDIKEILLKDLRIEQVNVHRNLPNGLDITIVERAPLAIIPCSYGYLDISQDGIVLNAHITLAEMAVPLITGVELSDIFVGDKVLDDKVKKVLEYLYMLDDDSRKHLSEINIENTEHVLMYTNNSVQIRAGKLDELGEKADITMNFIAESQIIEYQIEYVDFQYTTPIIKFKNYT